MKKIDMHCHTTNRKVEGLLCEYPSLTNLEDYMKQYNIEKSVVLATYFPHKGTGVSNFRLHNWVTGNEKFEMFGSLDFDHFYFQGLNELSEMAEDKLMKGIKIYTCYQHVDLHSDNFNAVLNVAKTHNLPMMFHVGYSYSCMSKHGKVAYTEPVGPRDLEFLSQENPEMNFIFSHMGKPFLSDLVEVVKNSSNVYTDNSGLLDSSYESHELAECVEDIKVFLGECGPEKLLFGTDFPVQTHEHSVLMIEQAMKNFLHNEKEKVYFENARRLLKL